MAHLIVLVVFLAFPSYVHPQITLLESGPGMLKPAETLLLSCKVTGFSISSNHWWAWIRQLPGKGLEWIGEIEYDAARIYYADSLKSRSTITKDNSKNEYYLQVKDTRAEDSGVYYCARRYAQCERGRESCGKNRHSSKTSPHDHHRSRPLSSQDHTLCGAPLERGFRGGVWSATPP